MCRLIKSCNFHPRLYSYFMKKYIILSIILLFGLVVNAQKPFKYDKRIEYKELKTDSIHYEYAISQNYITNRDYITFILWKINLYSLDFPSTILDAFPGYETFHDNDYAINNIIDRYYYSDTALMYLISESDWFVKDYMFNPKYIDYPVIGISWKQASKFNKWLSDRYNEHLLIKKDFYRMNLNQVNEDCFVSDSYLGGMYYGRRKCDSTILFEDDVLLSNFRLPTKKESFVGEIKLEKQQTGIKFLEAWENSFFKVKKRGVSLKLKQLWIRDNAVKLISNPGKEVKLEDLNISELYLSETKEDYVSAFKEHGYELKPEIFFKDEGGYSMEKDSLGLMNYLIIGRDVNGKKVLIEQDGFSKESKKSPIEKGSFKVFRYAVTLKHIK